MEQNKAIDQLKNQGQAIIALVADLSQDACRWKPDSQNWSVLEVLNHLADEEVLDFRRHLHHILYTPEDPWPEIDPQRWVAEKQYNQRELAATIAAFQMAREQSLIWLAELDNPNWDANTTLTWGTLTAGDMLASWLAHDLLHLRQLVALRYQLTAASCHPYRIEYAGPW